MNAFDTRDPGMLQCLNCGRKLGFIHRRVEAVRTAEDIRLLEVDGISLWCKQCHIATEYEFSDQPAA